MLCCAVWQRMGALLWLLLTTSLSAHTTLTGCCCIIAARCPPAPRVQSTYTCIHATTGVPPNIKQHSTHRLGDTHTHLHTASSKVDRHCSAVTLCSAQEGMLAAADSQPDQAAAVTEQTACLAVCSCTYTATYCTWDLPLLSNLSTTG